MQKPTVLVVLDGWGLAPPGPGNATTQANLSVIPQFIQSFPHTQLAASGQAVGLPAGEVGNTETGHINIGAGRIVFQDFLRISHAIEDKSFFSNDAFIGAINYTKKHSSNLHLMGVISDAGVHASRDHLYALMTLIKQTCPDCPVYLHLFTDGRDSGPKASQRFIVDVEQQCVTLKIGKIATIIGRYYAMDRDQRWERTEKAYKALTQVGSQTAPSAQAAIAQSHRNNVTDEFIEPTVILDTGGNPTPRITNYDSVIFFNYRIDRPRQLTRAFVLPDFETKQTSIAFDPFAVKYYQKHIIQADPRIKPFTRNVVIPNLFFVTMTEYEPQLPATVAFPPSIVDHSIGQVFSEANMRQLRVSETEKERFVTYYFNGMREEPFPGEDRLIIPSPNVATYDLQPEMSAFSMTEKLIDRLTIGVYSFVLINFANPDMVGHTGNIPAAIKALEVVDQCVQNIIAQTLSLDGTCILTADHGNVEEMLSSGGEMDTEHSLFPVPFVVINQAFQGNPAVLPKGKLADIAPTILALKKLPIPEAMTGTNLVADLTL